MHRIAKGLNQTIDEFLAKVSPKINWESNAQPGKLSNKEVIGHLIDSAQINLQRFVRCTYEDGFKLIYHQDEWVKAQHYNNADIPDLLELWKLLNLQIARVMENYPADRLNATCNTSRQGVTLNTVEFLANDYLSHLQHHLKQLSA